jgi:glucosamine-6-phosphate deaminase
VNIERFADDDALSVALATYVLETIVKQPALVLGLPTGRTPLGLYRELRERSGGNRIDWSRVRTFNLDEFAGLDPSHPNSYRAYMQAELFDHVPIDAANIGFLDGAAPDLKAECRRYEDAIESAGGIDLQILGIGANGHIGFNEPAPSLQARAHRAVLLPETRHSNASLFGNDPEAVPREALSMGMATILHARRIVLLATGSMKARCVERMIDGPVTPRLPASFLQLHRHVDIWLDRAAARNLG